MYRESIHTSSFHARYGVHRRSCLSSRLSTFLCLPMTRSWCRQDLDPLLQARSSARAELGHRAPPLEETRPSVRAAGPRPPRNARWGGRRGVTTPGEGGQARCSAYRRPPGNLDTDLGMAPVAGREQVWAQALPPPPVAGWHLPRDLVMRIVEENDGS